ATTFVLTLASGASYLINEYLLGTELFYLRAGSLNIFNGMVGLTFSCDGSHYLPWDEFLSKGFDFWASGKALG
ncbi:MAG TPA: hypothetical protein VGD18_01835, partial [Thiobacillaceae bacterium]